MAFAGNQQRCMIAMAKSYAEFTDKYHVHVLFDDRTYLFAYTTSRYLVIDLAYLKHKRGIKKYK